MKRYLLFVFEGYEAGGGWYDFEGSFDSEHDALHANLIAVMHYWHIVDSTTGAIIAEGDWDDIRIKG